jgi:hypothetical protein
MKILDVPRSGSYQGITSSRNRNGQYVRTRAIPVQPRSTAQLAQRGRQSLNAAAWRVLTTTQREGWVSLGANMTRTDALGQAYTLTGFQAYCSVNNILLLCASAALSDAPAVASPAAPLTLTPTITGGGSPAFSVAYTTTPLATGVKGIVRASPQRSAGRTFEGDFRVMGVTAAAAASPLVILTTYQARFGTPVIGNKIFVQMSNAISGFESAPLITSVIVS